MADETHALYKVLADFSNIGLAAKKAKEELKSLQRAERDFNTQSAANSKKVKESSDARSKGYKDETREMGKATTALKNYKNALKSANTQQINLNRNIRTSNDLMGKYGENVRKARGDVAELRKEHEGLNRAMTGSKDRGSSRDTNYTRLIREQTEALHRLSDALHLNSKEVVNHERDTDGASGSMDRFDREINKMSRSAHRSESSLHKLGIQLNKFRDFRPRLIPPFVALIPIVGALLGLINPLVAGLSAAGVAAFGMGANLLSISGAALAVIPSIVALISVVGALKAAFNGVGDAFSAFKKYRDAAGASGGAGGDGGKAELTRAEQIERAEVKVSRAQEDVRFAQEDLTKAREEYYDTIKKLTDQLNELSEAEDKAAVNAQLAAEWAEQVANDPNADESDKQAAADFAVEKAKEAEQATKDRQEGEKELNDAKGKGVEEDRQVIMAKRHLQDAEWALRDAQLDLINTQKGLNGSMSAAATAAQAYREALAKLSPSARQFVVYLTSMYDAWKKLQRGVQENFFSQFVDRLYKLKSLLGPVSALLNDAAEALGKLVGNLLDKVTSPKWLTDLRNLSATNVSLIESFGDALGYVLEIFKDLAVVAAPVARKMGKALATGAENLSNIVKVARSDGSLSNWLQIVYTRLQKWWTIIKNIGSTLFNYGKAASSFGDWLTDGFVKLTERWKASSEAATDSGSSFKQYLKDIKEPLRAVGTLLKSFVDWWMRVSKSSKNIKSFTNIIRRLTEDIGPAVAKLLDLFAASDTSDKLINSLQQLLEIITDFLEKGGLEGFESFFDTMHSFFGFIGGLIDVLPSKIIKDLATSLAIISALTFTGLGRILQALAGLLANTKLFGFLTGMKALGTTGAAATGTVVAGGAATSAKGGTAVAGSTGKGGIFRGGVGGMVLGYGANLVLGGVGDAVSDGNGGARDVAGSALQGAGYGAMIGATVAGPIGLLVGAITGAMVTGIYSGVKQWAESQQYKHDQRENNLNKNGKQFYYTQGTIPQEKEVTYAEANRMDRTAAIYSQASPQIPDVSSYEKGGSNYGLIVPETVQFGFDKQAQAYNNIYNSLVKADAEQEKYNNTQFEAAKAAEKATAEQSAYNNMLQVAAIAQDQATNAYLTEKEAKRQNAEATENLKNVLAAAEKEKQRTGEISAQTQRDIERATEDSAVATRNYAQATLDAGGTQEDANKITKEGQDTMDGLAKKYTFAKDEIKGVKDALLDTDGVYNVDIRIKTDDAQIKMLYALVTALHAGPEVTSTQIANFGKAMNQVYGPVNGKKKNTGGVIHRATGGSVPSIFDDWKGLVSGSGVNDSVTAMLTPGEFVMRRSAVNKIGLGNLQRLNAGDVTAHGRHFNGTPTTGSTASKTAQDYAARSMDSKLAQAFKGANGGVGAPSFGRDQTLADKALNRALAKKSLIGSLSLTINNPSGVTAEESIYEAHRELAFKYGW